MDPDVDKIGVLAERLIAAGLLSTAHGPIDVVFYALTLETSEENVRAALARLVEPGLVTSIQSWECSQCHAMSGIALENCQDCEEARQPTDLETVVFLRAKRQRPRDPAAVFLIHGMNTLGDWQQSLAWKIHLTYGSLVPVFVFKFGRDRLSPLLRTLQRRRTRELGEAVKEAQADLRAANRGTICDVIAHSFGTLLITRLLQSPEYRALTFGRVILTGSIAPREFPWSDYVAAGRVETVLNHRAGRDEWVGVAPFFCPDVDSSGRDGFDLAAGVVDYCSPTFRHSDFFTKANFDSTIRTIWALFLNNRLDSTVSGLTVSPRTATFRARLRGSRYWIGRALIGAMCICSALLLMTILGHVVTRWT